MSKPPFTILHIPHSSTEIPADLRQSFKVSDSELAQELLAMTDWFTDELFCSAYANAAAIIFPVSRLVIDPERFSDDAQEAMTVKGMGVYYTRGSTGQAIREIPAPEARQDLLNRYYWPHHRSLSDATSKAIDNHGHCFIADCHSFPSKPLPYEFEQSLDRPEICIGTDEFHTPGWMAELAIDLFKKEGFTVAVNHPFAGALVPLEYYQSDPRVRALMIELNRSIYMDEVTGNRLQGFEEVSAKVQRILEKLANHPQHETTS